MIAFLFRFLSLLLQLQHEKVLIDRVHPLTLGRAVAGLPDYFLSP